jgi:hypothetical protein
VHGEHCTCGDHLSEHDPVLGECLVAGCDCVYFEEPSFSDEPSPLEERT